MPDIHQVSTTLPLLGIPHRARLFDLLLGLFEATCAIAIAAVLAVLFAPPSQAPSPAWVIILTALVLARRVLSDYWFTHSERLGQTRLARYRAALSRRVIDRLPNTPSGAIGSLAIEGAEPIAARLARYPTLQILALLQPLLVLAVIAWIHWPVALGILITTPLIPLLMAVIGMGAKSKSQQQVESLTRLGAHYLDRIRGLETLWLLGGGAAVGAEIEHKADRLRQSTMGVLKLAFLTSAVLEFFSALSIALLAVYIGLTLLNLIEPLFGLSLSPVAGLCLLILAPEFYNPIRRVMAAWHDASEARSADDKVHTMIHTIAASDGVVEPKTLDHSDADALLALDQYSVGFASDTLLIAPFALRLHAHSIQPIFGPSGSGKTQLFNSLLNGQQRRSGTLASHGRVIRDLREIRDEVSWMGQHQWFDEGSIHAALTYGQLNLDAEVCEAMLDRVGLLSQLGNNPLARQLGPGGQGLSGGQLRRLGLARALLRQPTLLLLDEPTAHLDAASADQIAALILSLPCARLLVTHDARFAELPNRLVLNQGVLESPR